MISSNLELITLYSLKKKGNSFMTILVYIDHMIIYGNDDQIIIELKQYLNKQFHMKDMGS